MINTPLTRRLAHALMARLAPTRPPDFTIGAPGDPYLHRWYLIPRNPLFNAYLHHIVRDDDDRALHDHPWPSLSLMLAGALGEFHMTREGERFREIGTGSVVWRGPWFAHRLVVPCYLNGGAPHDAWTLFITGPRIRSWGFHCPRGWTHWRDFTDGSQIGKGCE